MARALQNCRQSKAPPAPVSWQQAMRRAVRRPQELCRLLDLPDEFFARVVDNPTFPLFVPHEYLARIRPGDPTDPLLRQVLPVVDEDAPVPGFVSDPVGDGTSQLRPGVLQKYRGRVLLIATGACAVHCRYCFRRHFPYSQGPRSPSDWQPALDQIAADGSISEVLLSGGDPWTLTDQVLAELIARLSDIPHLRRLRIHTRLPIMIPQRVTDELLEPFMESRLTSIVAVHINHVAEIDSHVAAALERLHEAGVLLLNQAVLLRGVNDDPQVLAELCERLIDLRISPYYLHQLDRVAGAAHFEVPQERGLELIEELRLRLPGYAVPHYVREVAGRPYKMPLA